MTATSSNKADAHVFVVSVSIAAGLTGATADAEILSSAVTNAKIGPDAHVSVTNGITVDAHTFGDNNLATAKASGGGGGRSSARGVQGGRRGQRATPWPRSMVR